MKKSDNEVSNDKNQNTFKLNSNFILKENVNKSDTIDNLRLNAYEKLEGLIYSNSLHLGTPFNIKNINLSLDDKNLINHQNFNNFTNISNQNLNIGKK